MKMSQQGQLRSRVRFFRRQRGWSQEELARRAGISRAAVSAIEIQRLVPSVAAALALAAALDCCVENLFGSDPAGRDEPTWAWPPTHEPCRFWHARVGGRLVLFPVERTAAGVIPHDGLLEHGSLKRRTDVAPENTLVMASCDPAAGLLAHEYAAASGFRLLVLPRSSREALDLLGRGLVDVAGVHLAAATDSDGNTAAIKSVLGSGYSLLKVASWQEGLAVGPGVSASSVQRLLRSRLRWVGRESGSGARQCQDELLQDRPGPRRMAKDHRGVAEAVRCGWADVGVCVRLACEEADLRFIRIRDEAYDLCFPSERDNDPRLRALVQVLRSGSFRTRLSELPGYDCRLGGETIRVV
jgi:molybdate-binding protein/transcriptional regulator with XRE-family HTH domain